MLNSDKIYNVR